MWNHVWKMLSQGFAFVVLWPFIPQFVCNCLFYWALYLSPIINIDLVVRHLMHPETQVPWRAACSQPGFVTQRRLFATDECLIGLFAASWLPRISVGWSVRGFRHALSAVPDHSSPEGCNDDQTLGWCFLSDVLRDWETSPLKGRTK